eukprot:GFKZ01004797.1.p1 GENE.GFKZ01004797.1~~GFKZ01004797.1.p1  ORF type:complete len:270 (-),score=24.09 GFKZ01004797.1:2109-2918(-)
MKEMWEQSRTRINWKARTFLSISHKGQTPASPTGNSISETTKDSSPQSNAPPKDANVPTDSTLLHDLRSDLSNFEQLYKLNGAPLSDTRILHIRKKVEAAMPRVYSLTEERNSLGSEARTVRIFAEDFLGKFPDANIDALRPSMSPEAATTDLAPGDSLQPSGSSASPRSLTTKAADIYVQNDGVGPHESLPGNGPTDNTAPSLAQCASSISPAQRTVLEAIHDLLSDDSERVPLNSQPDILRAPAAMSPEELQMRGSAVSRGFPPGMR